jgi:neutral amino acid ABC transporter ATP-binding protein
MTVPILSAKSLAKSFGGVQAVKDASIAVPQGFITGLIGPNGAGKTTFFNLLCNFIQSDRGTVQFLGQPIQHKPPHQVARMGMVRTFQVPGIL